MAAQPPATGQKHIWLGAIALAAHIVTAALCFALVAAVAFVIGLGVHWLGDHDFPAWMATTLKGVEYVLFVLDVATFVVYAILQALSFIVSLFKAFWAAVTK